MTIYIYKKKPYEKKPICLRSQVIYYKSIGQPIGDWAKPFAHYIHMKSTQGNKQNISKKKKFYVKKSEMMVFDRMKNEPITTTERFKMDCDFCLRQVF